MTIFGQNFLSQNPKKSCSSNFLWFKESTEFFVAKSETKNFPHFKGTDLWFWTFDKNQRPGSLCSLEKFWKFFSSDFEKNDISEIGLASWFQKCHFFSNWTKIFFHFSKGGVHEFWQKLKTKGPDLWNGENFFALICPQKIQRGPWSIRKLMS